MLTLIHQLSPFSAKCHLQICLIQWQVNGSEGNSDLPQARIYLYMFCLADFYSYEMKGADLPV